MKITKVNVGIVKKQDMGNLVGMATVEIDNILVLKDIKIIDGVNGLFIGMPSRKQGEEYKDIYFIKDKNARLRFQEKIINAYVKKVEQDIKDNDLTPVDDGDMPI